MTIQITGHGEKRAVVYPLLHLMNHFNGGLLLSDDGLYNRIITDGDGYVGNVRIHVGAHTSHAALKAEGLYTYGYDMVIRDVAGDAEEADAVIHVSRALPDEAGTVSRAYDFEVCADFMPPSAKKPYIPLTQPLLRELRDIEVSGRLGAFRNAAALRVLCPLLADLFSVSKPAIKNLLRKGGKLT